MFDEKSHEPENLCSGCRTCELTCPFIHEKVGNPRRSRIRVVKIEPVIYQAVTCRQCEDPICAEVCPVDVYEMEDGKSVAVNAEECLGCESCVEVCEEGAITVEEI